MTKMKRGEGMARKFMDEIARTGLQVEITTDANGPGLVFPQRGNFTPEQRELAADITLLAIGMPRNFLVLRKLMENTHG